MGLRTRATDPGFDSRERPGQVVADFVDPEPQDIPAGVAQAAGAYLVAAAEFAVPLAMVVLSVDFDIQLAVTAEEREIQSVRRFLVLRDRAESGGVHRFVEDSFPLGNELRIGHNRI